MLETLAILLISAVVMVPLSRRIGCGSVFGYLVAGALIGPAGLALVADVKQIAEVSELGVVMLLFLIGLEVRPQRLWVMRRAVFGLGSAQVTLTAAALAGAAFLWDVPLVGAVLLGLALALSSTAIALPMLAERELLQTNAGRDSFAVLLFQDLTFVPLVALVPLLAAGSLPSGVPWDALLKGVAAIGAILLGGRFLVHRAFRLIGGARLPEVFTAMALLIVVGTALIAHEAGLSASLGAFLAGVLLSDNEYRHELRANIEPFEGLLLGFFFISVGMSVDPTLALAHPDLIGAALGVLIVVKLSLAFVISRLGGRDGPTALRFAAALPQGSEFSFVILGAAVAAGVLDPEYAAGATLIVALSMLASPLFFAVVERWLVRIAPKQVANEPYDTIDPGDAKVIICGFGRVGQIIGRILAMQRIPFTGLERDPNQVAVVRRFGGQVYFGNPTRLDLLRSAGAEHARVLIVALDDMDESLKLVETVRRHFPAIQILARARNRRHAHLLMERGVEMPIRETYYSSLRLTEMLLQALHVPKSDARRAIELFQRHDEAELIRQQPNHDDERKLAQSAPAAAAELAALFEADRAGRRAETQSVHSV